jgi:hypothetical protein
VPRIAAVPEPFVQRLPGIDLTIEQATERAPDKSGFHVFHKGELVGSHKKLQPAQAQFKQLRDESGWAPPPKPELTAEEMLVREREAYQRVAHLEYWSSSHKFRGGGRPKRK